MTELKPCHCDDNIYWDGVCRCGAETAALREKVKRLEDALQEIAKPIEGIPVGDPWGFYEDMRIYAQKALEENHAE